MSAKSEATKARLDADFREYQRQHVGQWVNLTCEHRYGEKHFCHAPTVAAYPTMGGGYMALCRTHAEKHASICLPVVNGITQEPPYKP